jgi:hypothetical protein
VSWLTLISLRRCTRDDQQLQNLSCCAAGMRRASTSKSCDICCVRAGQILQNRSRASINKNINCLKSRDISLVRRGTNKCWITMAVDARAALCKPVTTNGLVSGRRMLNTQAEQLSIARPHGDVRGVSGQFYQGLFYIDGSINE